MTSTPLREWHVLSPADRDNEWAELVAWVTWLHDRYELGRLGGLPACWPEHPALIEELRALKTWREQIYESDEPAGQAARYWHTSLRDVLVTANAAYAANCAAGHRPAAPPADADTLSRWVSGDHSALIPTRLLARSQDPVPPDSITAPAMRSYLTQKLAKPLSQTLTSYVSYLGFWWHQAPDSNWHRITEAALASQVSKLAAAAQAADSAVRDADARQTQEPPGPEPESGPRQDHGE
jgi:hypothetical protein